MTQKDAVVKALQMLGGRSHLKNINVLAVKYIGNNTNAKQVEANIRRILNSTPSTFRHAEGLPNGWWELITYQDDVATLQQEIADLKAQLEAKDNVIEQLRRVPTEDAFVQRFVKETKDYCQHERKKAVPIRHILKSSGRMKEAAELDCWIEGKEDTRQTTASTTIIHHFDNRGGTFTDNSGATLHIGDARTKNQQPLIEE